MITGFQAGVMGTGRPLWTPANMTTALWLDAADDTTVTTVSGAVSQWNDKSGNGRNATQSTASKRPAYQSGINSRNVIRFTAASSQMLYCSGTAGSFNFLHSSQGLILLVGSVGVTENPNVLYGITGNSGSFNTSRRGFYILYDDRDSTPANNAIGITAYQGSNLTVFSSRKLDSFVTQSAAIFGAAIDAANATPIQRITLLINGSAYQKNTQSENVSTGNALYDLQIGDYGSNSYFFSGDIAEVIIANDPAAYQKAEGYLAHKWGLTASLPSDHPYKTAAPTV